MRPRSGSTSRWALDGGAVAVARVPFVPAPGNRAVSSTPSPPTSTRSPRASRLAAGVLGVEDDRAVCIGALFSEKKNEGHAGDGDGTAVSAHRDVEPDLGLVAHDRRHDAVDRGLVVVRSGCGAVHPPHRAPGMQVRAVRVADAAGADPGDDEDEHRRAAVLPANTRPWPAAPSSGPLVVGCRSLSGPRKTWAPRGPTACRRRPRSPGPGPRPRGRPPRRDPQLRWRRGPCRERVAPWSTGIRGCRDEYWAWWTSPLLDNRIGVRHPASERRRTADTWTDAADRPTG